MKISNKLTKLFALIGIFVLAAAATWVVLPRGGKIVINKYGIKIEKYFKLSLGLDLQGGSRLVYSTDLSSVEADRKMDAVIGARDVIERRVNAFGVSEPLVQVQGSDRIVVELPGVKDINEAINKIGQTPILEFREQLPEGQLPAITPNENGEVVIDPNSLWKPTGLSGKNLKRAVASGQSGGAALANSAYTVGLEFDEEGTKLFAEITERNLNKPVAIFIDNVLISQPVVNNTITNGKAEISGKFAAKDAKLLANSLNSGALPVPVKLVSQTNIGASLGKTAVAKSVFAGIVGLILIAFFMISFYRLPGVLAVVALAIYTIISIAIFKIGITGGVVFVVGGLLFLSITISPYFGVLSLIAYIVFMFTGNLQPVTLTLAGIAGFLLSIGMAVDANILIFERFKEEYRRGKSLDKALEDGFVRAWSSIRDSNLSSLITCFILYQLGTPSVKGFAITLGIGILISMFTAISITRAFIKLFINKYSEKFVWLFGVSSKDV